MSTDIVEKLGNIVGETNVLTGTALRDRAVVWETHQPCLAKAIVRPADTGQVAAIMKLCQEHGQSVVPYGGLTNLVQGCRTTPEDVAVSFEKMNAIENVDVTAQTMTVEAGVTMQTAQEMADANNLFPSRRYWPIASLGNGRIIATLPA